MKPFVLEFIITSEQQGMLLREYLEQQHISKTALTDIKYHGGRIMVNGAEQTVRYVLQADDTVVVQFPPESVNDHIQGENIPLQIVYEDDYILVVEKPANMSTIPSQGHQAHTLANAVVHHYEQIGHESAVHFVTRLDLDTSGLVLVAKYRHVHHLLSLAQQNDQIIKEYLAIVSGTPEPSQGAVQQPIGRVNDSIIKREVRTDGQFAHTLYRTIDTVNHRQAIYSLLRLRLLTGRTHQIRVHMAWLGHPLLGDALYGGDCTILQRQALHCAYLSFTHPITGVPIQLESILPEDLQQVLI